MLVKLNFLKILKYIILFIKKISYEASTYFKILNNFIFSYFQNS